MTGTSPLCRLDGISHGVLSRVVISSFGRWSASMACVVIPFLCNMYDEMITLIGMICVVFVLCLVACALLEIETWRFACPLIFFIWLQHNTKSRMTHILYHTVFIKCLGQCVLHWVAHLSMFMWKLLKYTIRWMHMIFNNHLVPLFTHLCHELTNKTTNSELKHKYKRIHLVIVIINSVTELLYSFIHHWIRNPRAFEETMIGYKSLVCEVLPFRISITKHIHVYTFLKCMCLTGAYKVGMLYFNLCYLIIKILRCIIIWVTQVLAYPLKGMCYVSDFPYVALLQT